MSTMQRGPAAARTTPIRDPRFMQRRLQRVDVPINPRERHEYRIRFHGQKTFIRATRLQAEQAIASQLGEVRIDTVVETIELRG